MALDFAPIDKKLRRAEFHRGALENEYKRVVQATSYEFDFREVRPTGGREADVMLQSTEMPDNELGVIAGDYLNNLRAALDYTVTILAESCGVEVDHKHHFPIFTSRETYLKKVGDPSFTPTTGPLHGISYGLDTFYAAQPFELNPAAPRTDLLFALQAFSNTDKHRTISATACGYRGMQIVCPSKVTVLKEIPLPTFVTAGQWYKIAEFGFDPPQPMALHVSAVVEIALSVLDPGNHTKALLFRINDVMRLHDHVAALIETFRNL